MSGRRLASGEQFVLEHAEHVATIASVGASLRELRVGARHLVLAYPADEIRPSFRGCVLAPWPNRVAHGRWSWRGADHQLPLTEPRRGHALHGLVAWNDWAAGSVSSSSVTLTTTVTAQPGYPFTLDLAMTWSLDGEGLHGELVAVNAGPRDAPYGCSIHPYLVAPGDRIDDWTLHVPAHRQLLVDEALIPTALVAVAPDHDFRSPRPIGATVIDHAFTGFDVTEGLAAVTVTDAEGEGARIEFGPGTPWVQICTSDWPGEPGCRAGVAVEPMTCPPDALNRHDDLAILAPGASHTAAWTIQAVHGPGSRPVAR